MPIYEYRCEHCGDFEEMQRITDPPLVRCPTCRRKVRRLISNTSFQLKGTGWYATDYARPSGGNGGKKEAGSDASTSSAGKAESKSDAKSDAKSEKADGTVERALDRREIARAVAAVARTGAPAVAVCLLHSYATPAHERQLGRALAGRGLHVTLSHRLLREYREYERLATTAVNAYVG